DGHRLGANQAGDLAVRVVNVAGDDRLLRADDDAGGQEILLDAMNAVVALGGCVVVRVDVESVVRAGLHARLAADALAVVEVDDAVRALVERLGGADADAGGVLAVVAAQHAGVAPDVREGTALDVLHPGAEDADRHLILRFAGGCAGMTAD